MLIGSHVGVNTQREKPLTIAQGKAFAVDRHFDLQAALREKTARCPVPAGMLPDDPAGAGGIPPGRAGRQWVFDTALPFNLITVAATVKQPALGIELLRC